MKNILLSIATVSTVIAGTATLSSAFFSDIETSLGNVLAATSLDLKIDNNSYFNGVQSEITTWLEPEDLDGHLFLNFTDIKPGDIGQDAISLHVDEEAWACVDITLTANDDATCTEPEIFDDPTCSEPNANIFDGELAEHVNFVFWVDDGDNVFETDEVGTILSEGQAIDALANQSWTLADSTQNLFGSLGAGLSPVETYYIGKAWCFGELTKTPVAENTGVNPSVASGFICNGAFLNNATQTDLLLADFSFQAYQHAANPTFTCGEECYESDYVDGFDIELTSQGLKKNGAPVDANRSDETTIFGAPDGVGSPASGFYSLGFGGVITLSFNTPVSDGAGEDLHFYEITNLRSTYPEEKALVEGSINGSDWVVLGTISSKTIGGFDSIDIDGKLATVSYLRITDQSDPSLHSATADGYDLDAIEAVYGVCTQTN